MRGSNDYQSCREAAYFYRDASAPPPAHHEICGGNMKNSISSKIYRLLKAFGARGEIYLYNREQVWSDRMNKACNLHKLYRRWDILDYMKENPDYKAKRGQEHVKEEACESFKQIDILLELVRRYKAGDG